MRVIAKGISKVDFLAPPYQITYNYQTKHKTCFNGILSIGIVSVALVFGALLGKELFLKETPIVSVSEAQEEGSSVRLFDYPLVFSIQDSLTLAYLNTDPSIMEGIKITVAELNLAHSETGLAVDYKLLFLQPCERSLMSSTAWEALGGDGVLAQTMCVNPHRKMELNGNIIEEDVVIINPYGQIDSSGVGISIDICKDESENCLKAQNALEKGILFGYASVRHFINTSDFSNPIKKMIQTGSVILSPKMNILTQMEYDITKLFDDKGLVFEDLNASSFVNFSRTGIAYKIKEEGDNLLSFTIGTKDLVKHVERLYLKMTQLFANLGGLLKVSIMIGKAMASVSSRAAFYYSSKIRVKQEQFIKANVSINNLVEPSKQNIQTRSLKKNHSKSKPGLFQYIKGLFSTSVAAKHGMNRETLFKYFDAKLLEKSITTLESKQKEIDLALSELRHEDN